MIPTNRRNKHKSVNSKNKIIIMLVVGTLAVMIGAAIIIFVSMNRSSLDDNELSVPVDTQINLQEETSCDMEAGQETDIYVENEKEYYVNYVDLAVLRNGSGVFDIHIRFPDGEDYVVVAAKKITDVTDEGFYVMLNDRENHMLSSAKTDNDVYVGTQLYLSRYVTETIMMPQTDYPWNQYVLNAHGIDESDAEEIYARRVQLEENLAAFMNQTLSR